MSQLTQLRVDVRNILAAAGIADAEREAAAIIEAVSKSALDDVDRRARAAASARVAGTPLEYLIGQTRFMGVDVFIAPGALIPRAETELLGQTALELLPGIESPRLIDMCCGSGNLACAIAVHRPALRVWASDLTAAAVTVARRNTELLGISDRVFVGQGDLFEPLAHLGLEKSIDLVVCNPPYISTGRLERDRAELLSHEPREAFDGGPYGVSIFQRVIRDAVAYLKPASHLIFEVGAGQERQVQALFARSRAYGPPIVRNDANGVPRVVGAQLL